MANKVSNFVLDLDYKSNLTQNLFLVENPRTISFILITYLLFVMKIGPSFMKNRPAYKLTNTILVYNVLQVIFSLNIVIRGFSILWQEGLMPHNKTSNSHVSVIHHYSLLKIVELLDTVFFVLRKKDSQVTFLHVYHHTYMVGSVWATVRYDPSFATLLPGSLNSLVHVFMYTYYTLSIFPNLAKFLWWKKYITSMQLLQFFVIISHMVRCHHTAERPPSFFLAYSMAANVFLFIILFSRFYRKTYTKADRTEIVERVKDL